MVVVGSRQGLKVSEFGASGGGGVEGVNAHCTWSLAPRNHLARWGLTAALIVVGMRRWQVKPLAVCLLLLWSRESLLWVVVSFSTAVQPWRQVWFWQPGCGIGNFSGGTWFSRQVDDWTGWLFGPGRRHGGQCCTWCRRYCSCTGTHGRGGTLAPDVAHGTLLLDGVALRPRMLHWYRSRSLDGVALRPRMLHWL